MFIFFFKQKTAYEMRISDWSSDVCSSDLFSDPMPAPVHKFNDEEWTLWSRFEVDDMPLRDFIQYFHDKHGLDITLVSGNMAMLYADFMPPKKKIGRASGRERGCQNG